MEAWRWEWGVRSQPLSHPVFMTTLRLQQRGKSEKFITEVKRHRKNILGILVSVILQGSLFPWTWMFGLESGAWERHQHGKATKINQNTNTKQNQKKEKVILKLKNNF
jgi:hypothetical protein